MQLRLMQQALRHNVPGNTMSDFFTTIGASLRHLSVLASRPGEDHDDLPVEGEAAGPAPANCFQSRFDRLRDELCCTDGNEVHLYAMCPERTCGMMYKLEQNKLLGVPGQRCSRKLLTEITEWPSQSSELGKQHPRAVWPSSDPEPQCRALLTLDDSTREAALVFTYRPVRLSLALVLARANNQINCEQWRLKAPPAELEIVEDESVSSVLNDVYDGRLWRDMQEWYPKDGEHKAWYDPHPPSEDTASESAGDGASNEPEEEEKTSEAEQLEREDITRFRYNGKLLAAPGTIALQLFVDWYQKHEQGHHSVGLIWACVLNLPREERYDLHNMMLVGVLPGPEETSNAQLQGALKILTEELQVLWNEGVKVVRAGGKPEDGMRHRVFLFNVVCDTPAMRATCGFGRESSLHGCPYCDGAFVARSRGSHRDWRPSCTFDPSNKQLRHAPMTHTKRLANASKWLAAVQYDHIHAWLSSKRTPENRRWRHDTVAQYLKDKVFSKAGESGSGSSRWSALLDLPYFDSMRCVPIDVMHNVLLGLCKHLLAIFTGHHDKSRPAKRKATAAPHAPAATSAAAAAAPHENSAQDGSSRKRQRVAAPPAANAASDASATARGSPSIADPLAELLADADIDIEFIRRAIMNKADREHLQTCMNSCPSLPRDIGRIAQRLVSLDSIKAAEWLNWFASFAVPSVRSLLRDHTRLTTAHLHIFERAARIVQLSTGYSTTPQIIDELHNDLVQIMLDVQQLAPDLAQYITPNMHLSLHLAEQLRDHGPASSWWSFPYERLVGHTANIPFRPGRSSVDTAKRLLALLQISAQEADSPDEKSVFGRTGWALPAGTGFEHGISRTSGGSRLHWYRFVGPQGANVARRLTMFRYTRDCEAVTGAERYPGLLFNSGRLYSPSKVAYTRSVPLSLVHPRVFPWISSQQEHTSAQRRHWSHQAITALAFVRQCLLAHHMTHHHRAIWRAYEMQILSCADGGRRDVLKDEQRMFETSTTDRSRVIASVLQSITAIASGNALAAAAGEDAFQLLFAWYQEQGGAQWDSIDVFDKLFYAGEEFGSAIVSGGQNAWITANYPNDEVPERVSLWYGRVCYYVRHLFAGRPHDFAMVRWFTPASLPAYAAAAIRSSLIDYPVVTRAFHSTDVRDLVPVQCLVGRWVPMLPVQHPAHQFVCPIRSRTHG
jgi:hypothetical protein